MNNETTDPDQADEEILITTVSDETLETAAGTEAGGTPGVTTSFRSTINYCC